ncbi:MAG: tol-pal system protein YbgF [Chromatiales bacterium]|jgi:tol-pal system protein YbgF|nr:tol-pal system protein YbgF [Chromatiales bacterium]
MMLRFISFAVAFGICFQAYAQAPVSTSRAAPNSVEARLQRVEQQLKAQALIELLREVRALRREVQSLRGENEVLDHKIEQMHQRLDDRMNQRIRDLQADLDQRFARGAGAIGSTPAAPAGLQSATGDAQTDYQAAVNLLQNDNFAGAISALTAFLQTHPKSELTGNALYLLGEANYVEEKSDDALTAFHQLATTQPNHPKVAVASLKIGYILDDQEKTEAAVAALEAVVKKFAGSTVESQARQRLDDIRSR